MCKFQHNAELSKNDVLSLSPHAQSPRSGLCGFSSWLSINSELQKLKQKRSYKLTFVKKAICHQQTSSQPLSLMPIKVPITCNKKTILRNRPRESEVNKGSPTVLRSCITNPAMKNNRDN